MDAYSVEPEGAKMTQRRNPLPPRRRLMPVWQMAAYHLLALGLALLLFALPHHVLQGKSEKVDPKYPAQNAAQPSGDPTVQPDAPAQTSDPAAQATQAPAGDPLVASSYSWWSDKFAETPYVEGSLHVGRNTRVEILETREETQQYFVADIYVRNVTHLVGVFAQDKVGKGVREPILDAAARTVSVVMTNGDYYGGRSAVICARNGELYKNTEGSDREACVLYADGTMKTFRAGELDAEAEMAKGAYHIFNFGPGLLEENGTPRTDFSAYDDISGRHPRTVLGYIEPGHYVLVVIDGRMSKIRGLSLTDLAVFMQSLGCVQAFNMDGGQTSQMVVNGAVINTPYKGGRDCSDYIAVID